MDDGFSDQNTTLATLKSAAAAFVRARDWERFHQPKDLAMAISLEAAELLQLFLWVDPTIEGSRPAPARDAIEAEVADVALCLLNLCNRLEVDLAAAIEGKLARNAAKYPVEKARGSALKYNEYDLPADTDQPAPLPEEINPR